MTILRIRYYERAVRGEIHKQLDLAVILAFRQKSNITGYSESVQGYHMALRELAKMTWEDVRDYFRENDTVILPTGATEWHGNHNALGTDFLIAESIAKELGRRTNLMVLPTIAVGLSAAHMQFHGTLTIPEQIYYEYVKAVCLSIASHGAKKIFIANAHGGNLPAIAQVVRECRSRGIFISLGPGNRWFGWTLDQVNLKRNPEVLNIFKPEEVGHATSAETSVNLALHPELVKKEKITDTKRKPPIIEGPSFYYASEDRDNTEGGAPGITSTAAADKGKTLLEMYLKETVVHIENLKRANIATLLIKPHI